MRGGVRWFLEFSTQTFKSTNLIFSFLDFASCEIVSIFGAVMMQNGLLILYGIRLKKNSSVQFRTKRSDREAGVLQVLL